MRLITAPLQIGARTVLAMTCWRCGRLLQGMDFPRYARRKGEAEYIDRRCGFCRWAHLERTRTVADIH